MQVLALPYALKITGLALGPALAVFFACVLGLRCSIS
jgi:hypothetical protein